MNQKVISRMLTKKGCRVDVAENGLDAVNMSDEEDYDLIFMDLRMPEKDGIEAVMDIRRRELQQNLNRIPIVAMTANAMGGDRDACIDAGMDDYVAKPVQIAKLTEVLERWVRNAKVQSCRPSLNIEARTSKAVNCGLPLIRLFSRDRCI